jgi:hypothetical protein
MQPILTRLFGIDPRSLATFRIGLGVLLLVDLAIRADDLTAHYTDAGVFTRELAAKFNGWFWRWSIHMASGDAPWQIALFVVAGGAAAMLVLGYKTRLATVVSWALLCSVQHRNPSLLNAGDALLRALLFWAMFLPLGRCWSLDARRRDARRRGDHRRETVLSVATASLLLQVALMYWFTTAFKWNEDWLDGLGLYYALSYDAYARPLAGWLLGYPELLRWLSLATLALESAGPVLAFSPFATGRIRVVVCLAFVLFHLGIELTLTVGMFSYVSMVAWSAYLPSGFWEFLARRQSSVVPTDPKEEENGESERPAPGPWSRGVYIAAQTLCGLMFLYTVAYNFYTLDVLDFSRAARQPAHLTGVAQQWNMFGTSPTGDGWLVAPATLEDGRVIDLLTGEPADYEKPPRLIELQANHRWRKYLRNLATDTYDEPYYRRFCQYLIEQWNAEGGAPIRSVDLYLVEEKTPPPGDAAELTRERLHRETIESTGAFEQLLKQGSSDLPPGI